MGEENCRETISSEELFFFDRKPAALPMYEVFRKSVLAEIPEAGIEVGKTQVSFSRGICLPLFHSHRFEKQRIVRIHS
jgi:hypothetical protein